MRKSGAILPALLVLSFSVPIVTAGQDSPRIPQEIAARNQARKAPIWVAAEKVAEEPDREDLFSPANRMTLHRRTAISSDRGDAVKSAAPLSLISEEKCSEFSAAPEIQGPDIKPHWSYEDVAENASSIIAGRVESIDVGFLDGVPGTLLRVGIDREVRRSSDLALGRYVYLYYPYATFQVAGQSYCTRDVDFSHRPKVGEGVLIFNFYPPLDAEGNLLYTHAEGLFFETASGLLVVPQRLRQKARKLPANSIEGLVEDLISQS